MDEKDWALLKTLHEVKSITQASKILYISQPALTKRLQKIEKEFSVKLVTRSKIGVTFTSEGEYLADYAKKMLITLQQTRDNIMNIKSQTVQGKLRIGVSVNFAFKNLPELLKRFTNIFPHIQTEIISGYSSDIIKAIKSRQIQIAIVRGEFSWSGPKIILNEESICLINDKEIDINELPNNPRINYQTDPQLTNILESWWDSKFSSHSVSIMEVGNSQIAVEMVKQGLGYALIPSYSFNQDHNNLFVKELYQNDNSKLMRNTSLIFHDKDLELGTVREFVNFIENNMHE